MQDEDRSTQPNMTAFAAPELRAFSRELVRIIDAMTAAECLKERKLHAVALWAALDCAGFLMRDCSGVSLEVEHA